MHKTLFIHLEIDMDNKWKLSYLAPALFHHLQSTPYKLIEGTRDKAHIHKHTLTLSFNGILFSIPKHTAKSLELQYGIQFDRKILSLSVCVYVCVLHEWRISTNSSEHFVYALYEQRLRMNDDNNNKMDLYSQTLSRIYHWRRHCQMSLPLLLPVIVVVVFIV